MVALYTHNRFNQVMLFSTYEEARNWCLISTKWTEAEIKNNIKSITKSGTGVHYNIFDC